MNDNSEQHFKLFREELIRKRAQTIVELQVARENCALLENNAAEYTGSIKALDEVLRYVAKSSSGGQTDAGKEVPEHNSVGSGEGKKANPAKTRR